MPTSRIKLGHKQEFKVNGTAYEGVRELDVDVTSREVDVTGWDHAFASTLPVLTDATLTVKLYYPDETTTIWQKLLEHPKQKIDVSVTGLISGTFVVSSVRVGCPMGGVVPHDVTFRLWNYA